jgi:diguanylate cyclase (GGDEF)-like protein
MAALTGQAQAAIGPAAEAGAGSATFASPTVLRELLPLKVGDQVLGVVGVWRDGVPILARLEDMRRAILLVTVSAGLVAAALLFPRVPLGPGASEPPDRGAPRVDAPETPLTDTLNHGTLVGRLAQAIERGRDDVRPIGIALIDLDGFRLLNDNHGHAAGDEALLAVASTLQAHVDPAIEFGRYGPDEFLLIAPPTAVAQLEPVIERLRVALVDLSLRFDETERTADHRQRRHRDLPGPCVVGDRPPRGGRGCPRGGEGEAVATRCGSPVSPSPTRRLRIRASMSSRGS